MPDDSSQPATPDHQARSQRRRRQWLALGVLAVAAAGLLAALARPRPQPRASAKTYALGWRPVTSFAGYGNTQTEPFSIETGQWRIKWTATPRESLGEPSATGKSSATDGWGAAGADGPSYSDAFHADFWTIRQGRGDLPKFQTLGLSRQSSVPGKLRVEVHSLVSGRFVSVAADHQGAGSGIAYLAEEPRQFFLDIQSSGLNWRVEVEEGIAVEQENSR